MLLRLRHLAVVNRLRVNVILNELKRVERGEFVAVQNCLHQHLHISLSSSLEISSRKIKFRVE